MARYAAEGEAGLLDRPSAARRVHNRTPEDRVSAVSPVVTVTSSAGFISVKFDYLRGYNRRDIAPLLAAFHREAESHPFTGQVEGEWSRPEHPLPDVCP